MRKSTEEAILSRLEPEAADSEHTKLRSDAGEPWMSADRCRGRLSPTQRIAAEKSGLIRRGSLAMPPGHLREGQVYEGYFVTEMALNLMRGDPRGG